MKKPIATIAATIGVLAAFAETSTNTSAIKDAPIATPEIKYPWESSAAAGLTLTRGNSQTLLFTAGLQTQRKTPTDE